MKAVQLTGYEGLKSLKVVEIQKPRPKPTEILIAVKAAGINFAESELLDGKYRVPKTPPFTMGFEAAGIVEEVGSEVGRIQPGDKVTGIVSSGGYAEYATAEASLAIPIPRGISFAEASTIPIQGLSAYALLKFAAKPQPSESILVQAAAGGVGLYLVQLAKILGAKTVIALAGSPEKVTLWRTSVRILLSTTQNQIGWSRSVPQRRERAWILCSKQRLGKSAPKVSSSSRRSEELSSTERETFTTHSVQIGYSS